MIDFRVENGDLVLNDKNEFETVRDSISQVVYITFSTFLKSWFYDVTFGIDYQNLKGNLPIADLKIKLQAILLMIPGVVGIKRFDYTYNANNRFYAFEVEYTTKNSTSEILTIGI
jgi:hypothetical protein